MTERTEETEAVPAGWRIGDYRPCGCEVVPVAVACDFHELEWQTAQTDCGDCEYGVPGVWHERNNDCTGEEG